MPFYQVIRTISAYIEAPDEQTAVNCLVRLAGDLPDNTETKVRRLSARQGIQLKARGSLLDEMP